MGRVVVVGSLNVDLVTRVERHPRPGETLLGEGLRATGRRQGRQPGGGRAGSPARTWRWSAASGDDDGGAAYVARLSALGIDCAGMRTAGARRPATPWSPWTRPARTPSSWCRGPTPSVTADDLAPLDGLGPGDVVLLQLEVPARSIAAGRPAGHRGAAPGPCSTSRRTPGCPRTCSPRATRWWSTSTRRCSWLDPGRAGVDGRHVRRGAGPAGTRRGRGGRGRPADEVVDTTGAGDAFCGALAAALAAGAGPRDAMTAAVTAATGSVARRGAQGGWTLA